MKRLPPRRTNTLQIIGFTLVTIVLAVVAATTASIWLYQPKIVKIAVAPADGVHFRFATQLAEVVKNNSRALKLVVVPTETAADALGRLNRGDVDLVVARSDNKIPSSARAMAILEHEVVFLLTPKKQKLTSISGLKGRRIGMLGDDPQNEIFVRRLLDTFEVSHASLMARAATQENLVERLNAPQGPQALIALVPLSRFAGITRREGFSRRVAALDVAGVDEGKALERKMAGVFAETIDPGAISSTPRWPNEEIESIALHHLLLVRSKLSTPVVTDLTRMVLEFKQDLQIENEFATRVEPPDVEKSAWVVAHQGAADYVNNEAKSFLDRYGDLFYIGTTAAGIFGTIFLGLYTWLTKVEPVKASMLAGEILEIGKRIRLAGTEAELDIADTELEDVLRHGLAGLQDGTLSFEGLDVFRLAHDNAHRLLVARRHELRRDLPAPALEIRAPAA